MFEVTEVNETENTGVIKTCQPTWENKEIPRRKSMCNFFIAEVKASTYAKSTSHFFDYEAQSYTAFVEHQKPEVSYFEVGWNERIVCWFE